MPTPDYRNGFAAGGGKKAGQLIFGALFLNEEKTALHLCVGRPPPLSVYTLLLQLLKKIRGKDEVVELLV